MSLQDWDSELAAVAAEMQSLGAALAAGPRRARRTLIGRKIRAVRERARLAHAFSRLTALTGRDLLLLPGDKALLHWGRIYTERAKEHDALRAQVLTKNLWLKLVRVRAGSGDLLEGDDLVALSVRQARVGKTERYLGDSLRAVRGQQIRLIAAYHHLAVAKANREAAACMTGSLRDPSPAVEAALGAFLLHLTAGARGVKGSAEFVALHQRYAAKALTLMSQCRNAVLGRTGRENPAPKALERFKAAVRQLDELDADIASAYRAAVPAIARPKLVQRRPGTGK
jgi:hypothetical protein